MAVSLGPRGMSKRPEWLDGLCQHVLSNYLEHRASNCSTQVNLSRKEEMHNLHTRIAGTVQTIIYCLSTCLQCLNYSTQMFTMHHPGITAGSLDSITLILFNLHIFLC